MTPNNRYEQLTIGCFKINIRVSRVYNIYSASLEIVNETPNEQATQTVLFGTFDPVHMLCLLNHRLQIANS